jgi:hypothetical protein
MYPPPLNMSFYRKMLKILIINIVAAIAEIQVRAVRTVHWIPTSYEDGKFTLVIITFISTKLCKE